MSKRLLKDNQDLTVSLLGQKNQTFRKKNDFISRNFNESLIGQRSMPSIQASANKGAKTSFSKADPLEQILMIQQNSIGNLYKKPRKSLQAKSQLKIQQKLSLPKIKQNVQFLGKPSSQLGLNSDLKGRNSLISAMAMNHSQSQDRIYNQQKPEASGFDLSILEQSSSLTASQIGFQVAPLKVKNFQTLQQHTGQNTSQQTTCRTRIPMKTSKYKGLKDNSTPFQTNPANDSLNEISRFSKLNNDLQNKTGQQLPSLTPSVIHYQQFMIPTMNDPSKRDVMNQWQNDSILIQNSEKGNVGLQRAQNNQRYSNFDATFNNVSSQNNNQKISVKLRESNLSTMVKRATQRSNRQVERVSTELREGHDRSSLSLIEQIEKKTSSSLDSEMARASKFEARIFANQSSKSNISKASKGLNQGQNSISMDCLTSVPASQLINAYRTVEKPDQAPVICGLNDQNNLHNNLNKKRKSSKKKVLMKKSPMPNIDLKQLKSTPSKKIEVSDVEAKKDSLRSPEVKPSARYMKSVSFRTGNEKEQEPPIQDVKSALPRSKNSDFESNIRYLDGSTERERSILKKRERLDTDFSARLQAAQDDVESFNSGRNSHQFDIYFTNPGRQISHSLPPSMQRPDLQQLRNYRNVEDVVHEDPSPVNIVKNASPKKPKKKTQPVKKLSPFQKVLNEEIKMIKEQKQLLKLSEICKQKNSSSLNRYYQKQLESKDESNPKARAKESVKHVKNLLHNSIEDQIRKKLDQEFKLDVALSYRLYENESKMMPIGQAFKKALESAQRSPMVVKPGSNMQDELYCNRMLPQVPETNVGKYEEQTISTFYSQSLRVNQDQEALKELQLLHKGLSCFTKNQNNNHVSLVQNISEQLQLAKGDTDAQKLDVTSSTDKLKEVQQQIKSTVQKVSKVVCNKDLFHIEIPIQENKDSDPSQQKISKSIELCQNSKFSLKVGVKGRIPPLKLKLEYFNMISGKQLSKQEMVSIKGCINIYYSQRNPDPRSNQQHEHSCQGCDGKIEKQLAPKVLKIDQFEHVHGKHVAQASLLPFQCEFIFVTIDCLDGPLLDHIRLEVQAQTQQPIAKKQVNQGSDEEEEAQPRLANTQKLGLHKFMKQTSENIEDMVEYPSLWEKYQKQVLSKIQKYVNAKRACPLRADLIDEQFLDSIEVPFEPHLSKLHIEQISENRKRVLNELLEQGDYVGHNKLNATFGKHDVESRYQKHIQFNNEYAKKQESAVKSKEEQQIQKHKMKVFLNYRKLILAQIKEQMAEEKYALALMRKKVMFWINFINLRQIYQEKLLVNFQQRHEAKLLLKKRTVCITMIIKAYKKLKQKKNAFVGERLGGPNSIRYPRYQITFQSQMLHDKYKTAAQRAFKAFMQDTAELHYIISKVSTHGRTVSILQKRYRKARLLDKNRIEALISLSEVVKRAQITQFISNQGSNQKSKQKQIMTQQLAKIRGLKEQTMRDICEKIYKFRKLKFKIQDRMRLKILMGIRFQELQRRLDILNEHENCDEFYHDDNYDALTDRFGEINHYWPWDKLNIQNLINHSEKYLQRQVERIDSLISEVESLQAFFGASLKQAHTHDDEDHHNHKPSHIKKPKNQGKKQQKLESTPTKPFQQQKPSSKLSTDQRIQNLGLCLNSSQDISLLNRSQFKWGISYQDMEKLVIMGIQIQENQERKMMKLTASSFGKSGSGFVATESNLGV